MGRQPGLLPASALTAALLLAVTGCAAGSSQSTQAEQAMYSAASKPLPTGRAFGAGGLLPPHTAAGGPATGLRIVLPGGWATLPAAVLPRAMHQVGLGRAWPATRNALLPGAGATGSVILASPGSAVRQAGSRVQALLSLSCSPDHFPAGTDPLTGLTALVQAAFSTVNASNAQFGETSVDGRPAVLSYAQAAVGSATVTSLQYAIAAPAGRVCYVALATQKPVSYEPAFGQLRPDIHVLD